MGSMDDEPGGGRAGGKADDLAGASCARQLFDHWFHRSNDDPSGLVDLEGIRLEARAVLEEKVRRLRACGAGVTLGGMTALLVYEGGLRVGAYNTRCEENSYNPGSSGCDADPEALYSYQFGLGGMHTSNFHPCNDPYWTGKMRDRLNRAIAGAGFRADPGMVDGTTAARLERVCPSADPAALDHYLLRAHDLYGVPRDGEGNYLAGYGSFPLLSPRVSIDMSFGSIDASCEQIDSDREAITVYGGGDSSYGTRSRQDAILGLYWDFAADACR